MYVIVNGKALLLFGQSSYHNFGSFITTLINLKKQLKQTMCGDTIPKAKDSFGFRKRKRSMYGSHIGTNGTEVICNRHLKVTIAK